MEKSERKNYILYYCYIFILYYLPIFTFFFRTSTVSNFIFNCEFKTFYLFIYLDFLGETTVTVKEIRELQGLLNKVK